MRPLNNDSIYFYSIFFPPTENFDDKSQEEDEEGDCEEGDEGELLFVLVDIKCKCMRR